MNQDELMEAAVCKMEDLNKVLKRYYSAGETKNPRAKAARERWITANNAVENSVARNPRLLAKLKERQAAAEKEYDECIKNGEYVSRAEELMSKPYFFLKDVPVAKPQLVKKEKS